MKNWDMIVAVLGIHGSANRILPEAAEKRVRAHADGFGKMSIVDLEALDALFDWSHVRDSSPQGILNVAKAIRVELMELDMRRAAKFGVEADNFQSHERMVAEIVSKVGVVSA